MRRKGDRKSRLRDQVVKIYFRAIFLVAGRKRVTPLPLTVQPHKAGPEAVELGPRNRH